ncbi:MAG: hypothetical protein SGJ13_16790 [Actinomycetota bacterium]|nr:hypothetical protein [Actinomycetota bacterium]
MARIVMVHGAYNELWGPHEIAQRWVPALRDGLWHHGVNIEERDVGICFYGDLFRRNPESEHDKAFAQTRAGVADALTNMPTNDFLDKLKDAADGALFDRTVDMVTTMSTMPDLSDRIQGRVASLVKDDTRVIIGHSLGSIVAYRALSRHPEWKVHTLVTLGSPLGAEFVQSVLAQNPGPGAWPGSVESWVNVAAVTDKIARPARLATTFGDRVEDHLVDNGARGHDPEPYLNAAATGGAIARALGGK